MGVLRFSANEPLAIRIVPHYQASNLHGIAYRLHARYQTVYGQKQVQAEGDTGDFGARHRTVHLRLEGPPASECHFLF